jgi:transcriptional regulator with GAF, ATPase, and Fis domain
LLESELFGHEREPLRVRSLEEELEAAEGGTVFLDEIGELAVPMQAKLCGFSRSENTNEWRHTPHQTRCA